MEADGLDRPKLPAVGDASMLRRCRRLWNAVFRLADSGPGIPEAMREQVFPPFFRLEASRNRETGGSGPGLAIARHHPPPRRRHPPR